LQLLLALAALACVVLAEPQNVEVNRPVGRLRIPGRERYFSRPRPTTFGSRVRPLPRPVPRLVPRPNPRTPAVPPVAGPPAAPVAPAPVPAVAG
jgi:hypothetical protein